MEKGSSSTSGPPQQKTTLSTDQFPAQEPRAVAGVNLGLNLLEDVPPVAGEQVPSPIAAGAQVVVIAAPRAVAGVNLGLKMKMKMEEGSSSTSGPPFKTTLSTDQVPAQEPRAVAGVNIGLNLLEDMPPVAGEQVPSPIAAGAQVVVLAAPRAVAGVNLGLKMKMDESSSSTSGPPLKQQKTTLSTEQVPAQEIKYNWEWAYRLAKELEYRWAEIEGNLELEIEGNPELEIEGNPGNPELEIEGNPELAYRLAKELDYRWAEIEGNLELEIEGNPELEIEELEIEGNPGNPELEIEGNPGNPEIEGNPELEIEGNLELEIEGNPGNPELEIEGNPGNLELEIEGNPELEIEGNPELEYRWAKMTEIEDGRAKNLAEYFRSFRRRRYTGRYALSSQSDLLHFHMATSLNHHRFCRTFAKKCHGGRLRQILEEECLKYRVPPVVDAEDIVLAAVPALPQAPFPMVTPLASVVVPQAPMVVARDFYGYLESFNIRYSGAGSDRTLRDLIHFHLDMSQEPRRFCESLAVEISAVGDRQIFYDRLQRLLWEEFEAYVAYLAAGHPIIAEENTFAFGDDVSPLILALQRTLLELCPLPAGQQVSHRYMRDVNKAVNHLGYIFIFKRRLYPMLITEDPTKEEILNVLGPVIPGFIMKNFPYLMPVRAGIR